MAKTGFWLRNAKGKLAGATIYQQNGETVMREIVSPSNPNTNAQILQRIVMHTVMQAYSRMKSICDHSFEGKKKGQECMSYFMKQNVSFARQKIADMQAQGMDFDEMYNFVPLGVKGFTPNQYQISMGSLPQITTAFVTSNQQTLASIPVTDNTYQGVCDALGLRRGDQLTFMVIKDIASATAFGQNEFIFCRVILDPTNEDHSQAPMSTPFLSNGSINLPSVRNENTDAFTFAISDVGLTFKSGISLSMAAAVIASREVNGEWLRSTAYMAYRDGYGTVYSLGECVSMAKKSGGGIYTANSQYLNNAGEGGGAAAAAGQQEGGGGQSGQGGSTAGFQVQRVTFDGSVATVGTPKTIIATSLPKTVATVVTFTTTGDVEQLRVKKGGENVGNLINIDGNSASFNINAASAGTYAIYGITGDGEESALGYSVKVEVGDPDDGD